MGNDHRMQEVGHGLYADERWHNIIILYPQLFFQNPPFVFMDLPHLDAAGIFAYLESEDVNGEYDLEAVLLSDGLFLDHTAPALTDEPNCETLTLIFPTSV